MANHGFVKTRKTMRPGPITHLLNEFNKTRLHGNLQIVEYPEKQIVNDDPLYTWITVYRSPNSADNKRVYSERMFWLNSPRSFEMRHLGGSAFDWWIDSFIINEIAVRFNGIITDDGSGDDKWRGVTGKYDTLKKYFDAFAKGQDASFRERWAESEIILTPPEFVDQLK